jgi:hypothetical protein
MIDKESHHEVDELLAQSSLGIRQRNPMCQEASDDSVANVLRRRAIEALLDLLDPQPAENADYQEAMHEDLSPEEPQNGFWPTGFSGMSSDGNAIHRE